MCDGDVFGSGWCGGEGVSESEDWSWAFQSCGNRGSV